MWGPMDDVITLAQFQLNWFRGYGAMVTPISVFPIYLAIMTLTTVSTTVLYCDTVINVTNGL